MRIFRLIILGSLLFALGCGGEATEAEEQSNSANGGEDTNGEDDTNDGEDSNGEEETCEPVAECAVDECGEIDDGCGGVLNCGVCDCVDGVAAVAGCGICDLGTIVCEAGVTGAGGCEEPDIPGVEGCEDLVFVDRALGSDEALGTKDDPVATLIWGVETAKSKGAAAVILAGGFTMEYDGPVLIEEPISIIGGYSRDWVAMDEVPTIVSDAGIEGMGDQDIVGVSVQGVSGEMIVANLAIETANAVDGGTNYGIHVYDSSGLELRNLDVEAGDGGAGADGEDGADGQSGEDGGDATEIVLYEVAPPPSSSTWAVGFVGEAGVNPGCPEADGAFGGRGGYLGMPASTGGHGLVGEDASQANGGAGGIYEGNEGGDDGEDGPFNAGGPQADFGVGGTSSGNAVGGFWVPGGDGGSGESGIFGYGGGGGGGGAVPSTIAVTIHTGSYGGGGAAGGCGGEGGEGGKGGGGSFGIFVASSDLVIERSKFIAGAGGDGGKGGAGGSGGEGGEGGVASARYGGKVGDTSMPVGFSSFNATGGRGGDGADGQDGGAGGGGAGGVSYGGYCADSAVVWRGTLLFRGGRAASGGASSGFAGAPGDVRENIGCD